ncbi:MAG: hypothetical protein R6X34_25000, partial [Chloroflexota bacterium]
LYNNDLHLEALHKSIQKSFFLINIDFLTMDAINLLLKTMILPFSQFPITTKLVRGITLVGSNDPCVRPEVGQTRRSAPTSVWQ